MTNFSKIHRPIILQRAKITTNDLNEEISTWEPLGRVFAERSYKNATEVLSPAQQVQATLITRFKFRWAQAIADFNPKDRIQDDIDGRIYDIKGVYEIGRQQWIEVHCTARAD